MRKLSTLLLALALMPACAGLSGESRMGNMASTWSTIIAPMANAAIQASESLDAAEKLRLRSGLYQIQELLDSGEIDTSLAIASAWASLRPFAEAEIQARVESGRLSESEGFAYRTAIALFETQLIHLLEQS